MKSRAAGMSDGRIVKFHRREACSRVRGSPNLSPPANADRWAVGEVQLICQRLLQPTGQLRFNAATIMLPHGRLSLCELWCGGGRCAWSLIWLLGLTYSLVVSRQRAYAMKTKPQYMVLAVSCFLAGFLTCYILMEQPQSTPAPAVTVAAPILPPIAMLTLSTISTQTFLIDGGTSYIGPGGERSLTPPAMPQPMSSEEMRRVRPGYYDLIDTRSPPDIELKESK